MVGLRVLALSYPVVSLPVERSSLLPLVMMVVLVLGILPAQEMPLMRFLWLVWKSELTTEAEFWIVC